MEIYGLDFRIVPASLAMSRIGHIVVDLMLGTRYSFSGWG
jgi:hypothetical protein